MKISSHSEICIILDKHIARLKSSNYIPTNNKEEFQKILNLVVFHRRKLSGLHFRWHKNASIELALLTIEELRSRKKSDPVANKLYEIAALTELQPEVIEKILDTAETYFIGESAKQSARAKTPRKISAVEIEIAKYVKQTPDISPDEIIKKLVGMRLIEAEEGSDKYWRLDKNRDISIGHLKNLISKQRKQKK